MEWAGGSILFRYHQQLVARRLRVRVHDVEVRAPVLPARARQGGPPEYGRDPFRPGEGGEIQWFATTIQHRPLAPELAVPDGELAIEIPEARESRDIDSIGGCGGSHRQERRRHFDVQGAAKCND